MKTLTASVAIVAWTLAAPALAASDGVLGPTSSGSFTVNATVSQATSDNVQVFGLDDYSLSWIEGVAGDSETHSFCIIRTPAGGTVSITISSFDAADTTYLVKTPGGGDQVTLTMSIESLSDGVPFDPAEGTPFPGVQVSSSCNDIAGDATSQTLEVATATAIPEGSAGIYSGSFLITVAPD